MCHREKILKSNIIKIYNIKKFVKYIAKIIIPPRIWQLIRKCFSNRHGDPQIEELFLNNWHISRQQFSLLNKNQVDSKGINLIGYVRAMTGIGEAARSTALALNKSKIPYSIIDFNHDIPFHQIDNSLEYSLGKTFNYNVNLIHVNPLQLPYVWESFGEENLSRQYNIGVWYWELQEFPDEWISRFNVVDEIWVASEFVRKSIQIKSTIPVIKVPPCIEVNYDPCLTRRDFDLPEGKFLYLCAYDTLSVHERKNPSGAINAFIRAFSNSNLPVGLVIKINNAEKNLPAVRQLKNQLKGYKNCYVIEEFFTKKKFCSLLKLVDVYISLHRSEGFGLIPAEAMYLGKPVIMTNWSGNKDFMTDDNSCGVNFQLIPVGKNAYPYDPNQLWADPDIDHAIYYLKKLFFDSNYYSMISRNASNYIRTNLSPDVVGQIIRERLSYLQII